jgi:Ca2+-binding RTX toxin-like protein
MSKTAKTLSTAVRSVSFFGTSANDFVFGSVLNDILMGKDGNDTLSGDAGADLIDGGNGNDLLSGGADKDSIYAGSGNDTASGDDGDDFIDGNKGDDLLSGGNGNDFVFGGDGNDTIAGGDGNDNIDAGAGNDVIEDGAGNDSVSLGTGADIYIAGLGSDSVSDASDKTDALDTADYSRFTTAVTFTVAGSIIASTINEAGINDVDSLGGMEILIGTSLDDTFVFQDQGISSNLKPGTKFGFQVYGGDGADTFVLSSRGHTTASSPAPIIKDFTFGEDKIAVDPENFSIGEFVPVLDENGNPVVEQVIVSLDDLGGELPLDENGEPFFEPVVVDGVVVGVVLDEFVLEEFVNSDLSFQNVARAGDDVGAALVDIESGHNVYVLKGSFLNSGAASDALQLALSDDDFDDQGGIGVYFDATAQQVRVFSTLDLDNVKAAAVVIGNLETGLGAEATIDLLATLTANDFLFV